MTRAPSAASLSRERLRSQLLAGPPAGGAVEVTRRLLAVQGQDARGVRLAVRARSRGTTAADVDSALGDERALLITWLNRGTLHLLSSEDYHWLHALTAPPRLAGCERRLAQLAVSAAQAERGVATIVRALGQAPLDRRALGEHIARAGVPTAGQALIHVLMLASLRGLTVRAPVRAGQHCYVLVADWLGRPPRFDRERALAELARRYLAGHAPAGERDLARWAGLPLRDARAGFAGIASELQTRAEGLSVLAGKAPSRARAHPKLLGAFDPLLLGWCSRSDVLGAHEREIVQGGMFRPFAAVDGRAVGTWRIAGASVELTPREALADEHLRAFEEEAQDVLRFLEIAPRGDAPALSLGR
ncbi:MAG TPA: winged helix DNA-binding domain-containing protein [Solirubrobacteraceae bacterium]|nr:winged helix DNA-binding domain-containing protein [Solirubrobacteraceae bacterium]